MKQQKLDCLGTQRKGFALATSDIQGLVEFVERSVTIATDEEVMLLQKDIQEKIREQREKHERIDLVPAEVANIGVRVNCSEGISDLCQKNAAVIVLPADPTKCTAEGPGVKGAEVGKAAQFTVHAVHRNGQLCKEKQIVEAEVMSNANGSVIHTTVVSKLGGVYEVIYTPEVRGRHAVVVKVNGTQIAGSPFRVVAKLHPTQLGKPVRVVEGLDRPWQITFNSKQQLVVGEWGGGKVIVFDKDGNRIQTIECERLKGVRGVAVDKDDSYVADGSNSILKFSKEGKLVKVVGQRGAQPGEFNIPTSVKIINDKLYLCDHNNHRVQILNRNMEYVESFGCEGSGDGEFIYPYDLAQDRAGNLYVSEYGNNRVQVLNCKGQFLYSITKKGAASEVERVRGPRGVCVDDQFVYVCDSGNKCVSVFKTSGEFVTSFGQFSCPVGIALDDGFVHVSDYTTGKLCTF